MVKTELRGLLPMTAPTRTTEVGAGNGDLGVLRECVDNRLERSLDLLTEQRYDPDDDRRDERDHQPVFHRRGAALVASSVRLGENPAGKTVKHLNTSFCPAR